ncbi:MAG: hypothetical protein DRJ66_01160 [Thermoprotei archaeon]|nr:MAG: hypothetical protein DRJ66_01160 [Thermoprotei archaeon]RLF19697.1 MAG: hypothetical protein DRZ82_04880 [Thermoprotei archaeon]
MRRYRCWHDVIESLLKALLTGEKRITELCLHANIPVDRGRRLIEYLIRCGLIFKYEKDGRIYYRITEKGYEWLGIYRKLKEILHLSL